MKKKVLFIITKSNWGGAQRYVFDLATHLPQEEFEVVVALGGTGEADAAQGALDKRLRAAGVRTIFVSSFMRDMSLRREWQALSELRAIIRNERPDVVHLNSSKAGGVGALAARLTHWRTAHGRSRAKIVFTSHGLAWDEDRNMLSKALIYAASRLTFLLSDIVITITKDNFNRASSCLLCRNKFRLVHNGIEALPFMPGDEARATLGLPAHTTIVGTIANLEWNKGLHFLVRAVGDLARDGKDIALAIIGEGDERTFLQTLIEDESLGTVVHLLGFKEHASQYLKAFDVFALPSVKEGLPYVLIEAGQAGLPVVGSNIPGIAEIVGNNVSGLLARPKDHHDLARKLGQLVDNPELRHKLGDNLQSHVAQEFSIQKMVADTAALYH